jgi:hypothetical protein
MLKTMFCILKKKFINLRLPFVSYEVFEWARAGRKHEHLLKNFETVVTNKYSGISGK